MSEYYTMGVKFCYNNTQPICSTELNSDDITPKAVIMIVVSNAAIKNPSDNLLYIL